MKKLNLRHAAFFALAAVSTVFVSCGDDDGGDPIGPGNGNKNYKYTLTVDEPIDETDFISFVIVGASGTQQETMWKVNNTPRTGEQGISLGRNEFKGGTHTYVVESVQPLRMASLGVQLINFDMDLKYAFKIEVNGEVKVNESGTLKGDGSDFTRDYNF